MSSYTYEKSWYLNLQNYNFSLNFDWFNYQTHIERCYKIEIYPSPVGIISYTNHINFTVDYWRK
jgi:hypothetical protein